MKKSMLFSLLFLPFGGLYAMEAGESVEPIPESRCSYSWLPAELDRAVMAQIQQDPMSVRLPLDEALSKGENPGIITSIDTRGKYFNTLCVSPDGRRKAFVDSNGIVVAPLEECRDRELREPHVLAWSSDGKCVAWCDPCPVFDTGEGKLCVCDAETGRNLFCAEDVSVFKWSPNNEHIAIGSCRNIRIVRGDTGEEQAKIPLRESRCGESDYTVGVNYHRWNNPHSFSWSPDSRFIVLREWPSRSLYGDEGAFEKRIVHARDGTVIAEGAEKFPEEEIVWHEQGIEGRGIFNFASVGIRKGYVIRELSPAFLLATQQIENSTLSQFLLLKRVQKKLLKDKVPLLIGALDRFTLDEMSELKKLLKIEHNKNTKGRKADLWRLQLKRDSQDADKREQGESGEARWGVAGGLEGLYGTRKKKRDENCAVM